jgi:hypothetical protein
VQGELFQDIESLEEIGGDTQVCKICSKEKHISFFHKASTNKNNLDTRCKACFKKDSKYRVELRKRYEHLKTNFCECCGNTSNKSLVVDHCHDTLRFRGWICQSCNHGIGNLGDDIKGVEKALEYLRKHNEQQS